MNNVAMKEICEDSVGCEVVLLTHRERSWYQTSMDKCIPNLIGNSRTIQFNPLEIGIAGNTEKLSVS